MMGRRIDDGGFNRVADGIVHFRCLAYDTNGVLFTTNNIIDGGFSFTNNAVPAYVDLELGILEPRVIEQARSIPNPAALQAFLGNINQASKVHLFRQHISIRTASQ